MPTVLVIDDEELFLNMFDILLKNAGYTVVTAASGREGLEKVYLTHPDLVLVDDMLPEMSGGDICNRVKHDPTLRDIPVILCSAGPRVRDRDFIRRIGADGAMAKPFRAADVLKMVESCLVQTA